MRVGGNVKFLNPIIFIDLFLRPGPKPYNKHIIRRMANQDRAVAIRSILEVFNETNNKEAFKRMLFDEAARDIKSFYKEFVVPVMPKDMKLEVEGILGVADVKNLLGNAIITPAFNEIEVHTIDAPIIDAN